MRKGRERGREGGGREEGRRGELILCVFPWIPRGEEKVPSSVPEEDEDRQQAKQVQRDAVRDFVIRRSNQSQSATELRGLGVAPGTTGEVAGRSPGAPKKPKPVS